MDINFGDKDSYGYRGELKDSGARHFRENSKHGLVASDGTVLLECKYDAVNKLRWFGHGFSVWLNGKVGAINERGEWMYQIEYEDINPRFHGGHFLNRNGKWGFMGLSKEECIDFLYEELDVCSYGTGFKAKLNGKYGYLDSCGNTLVPFEYNELTVGYHEMVKVRLGDRYGFYNLRKKLFTSLKYAYAEHFYRFNRPVAVVAVDKLRGVVDDDDNLIIPMRYERIKINNDGSFNVEVDGKASVLDKDGNCVLSSRFKSIGIFKNGVTFAENEHGLYGYIDEAGNVLIDFKFKHAENFEDDYAVVALEFFSQYGVIDRHGKFVVPPIYDYVSIYRDGIIRVATDDRANHRHLMGIYDMKNNVSMPCGFERIDCHRNERDGYLECLCYFVRHSKPMRVILDHTFTSIPKPETIVTPLFIEYSVKADAIGNYVEINDIQSSKPSNENYVDSYGGKWIEWQMKGRILLLPKEINGLPVKTLHCCERFSDKFTVRGLIVPEGYQRIVPGTFCSHPSLEFVSLPKGLQNIGHNVFCECPKLKRVFLGAMSKPFVFMGMPKFLPMSTALSFIGIDNMAFRDCNRELTFYLPEKIARRPEFRSFFKKWNVNIDVREKNEEEIITYYQTLDFI